jgi:aromatic ring-cleaving dioxygenase
MRNTASVDIARFSFQLDDASLSPEHTSRPVEIEVAESGVCHGLVVWWDIDLGGVTLTMDPWNYQQWRDHWLQAVHLWPRPLRLNKGLLKHHTH